MIDQRSNERPGFTIVELLIVIVVIAILAAVSVVVYTGVQQRAITASYNSAAEQWYKLLEAERVLRGGRLPSAGGNYICLGSSIADFPAADGFAEGECTTNPLSRFYNDAYISSLQMYSSVPSGRLPVSVYEGPSYTVTVRGIHFLSTSTEYRLLWRPPVTGQCGIGQAASGKGAGLFTGEVCYLVVTYD